MKTIILLLFLSTTLFGCLNSSNPYSETHGEIKQNSISTLSDDELKSIALEKNDITYCDKLQYSSDKNECYLNLALKYQNPSYCSKIIESKIEQTCKDSIKIESSVASSQITSTNDESASQSNKIVLVSQKNSNSSIIDEMEKCKKQEAYYDQSDCFVALALEFNNIGICSKTINQAGCISNVAAKYNNSKYCYQIIYYEDQDKCLAIFNPN